MRALRREEAGLGNSSQRCHRPTTLSDSQVPEMRHPHHPHAHWPATAGSMPLQLLPLEEEGGEEEKKSEPLNPATSSTPPETTSKCPDCGTAVSRGQPCSFCAAMEQAPADDSRAANGPAGPDTVVRRSEVVDCPRCGRATSSRQVCPFHHH
ncbi:hypothetical protein VTK56DRAFT_6044 [Thermocarpiscus australiensis]